jgi:hypothetical protein
MLKIFVKRSHCAGTFSPRCFLSKKDHISILTKTKKFDFNPVPQQKGSIRHLNDSSNKKHGKVKENGDVEFDIGNRRKISVVIYKDEIKIDIRQFYKDDYGEDKVCHLWIMILNVIF